MYVYIYIYIYMYGERERERDKLMWMEWVRSAGSFEVEHLREATPAGHEGEEIVTSGSRRDLLRCIILFTRCINIRCILV